MLRSFPEIKVTNEVLVCARFAIKYCKEANKRGFDTFYTDISVKLLSSTDIKQAEKLAQWLWLSEKAEFEYNVIDNDEIIPIISISGDDKMNVGWTTIIHEWNNCVK